MGAQFSSKCDDGIRAQDLSRRLMAKNESRNDRISLAEPSNFFNTELLEYVYLKKEVLNV